MNKARPAMGVALKAKIAVEAFGSRGGIWQYDIMWITTALKLEEAAEHRAVRVFDLKIGQDVENVAQHEIEELHVRIDQLTIENDFFGQQIQKKWACRTGRYSSEVIALGCRSAAGSDPRDCAIVGLSTQGRRTATKLEGCCRVRTCGGSSSKRFVMVGPIP